jgi:hypothetical protein
MKTLATTVVALAAGCTSSLNDTTFDITGRIAGGQATHVVAVSPDSSDLRAARQLDADGSFDLPLSPGHTWIVSFADARQRGSAMLVGSLRMGTLDAIDARAPGLLDVGELVAANRIAQSQISWDELGRTLGVDPEVLERIGASDDLALRYANPDVDDDGVLDAVEPDHAFNLSLYSTVRLVVDSYEVSINDMVNRRVTPEHQVSIDYLGTGVELAMPAASPAAMNGAKVTFDQPFYGATLGDATPTVPAGTPIGEPAMIVGQLAGNALASVVARPGFDVPGGNYHFAVDGKTLTFSNVVPPSNDSLVSGENLVVPFVNITPKSASCQADCEIASVDLKWMRNTATGWILADEYEMPREAHIDIVIGGQQKNEMRAPLGNSPILSVDWDGAIKNAGLVEAQLAGMTSDSLCYVGVSYIDRIGVGTTSMVTSPGSTCNGAGEQ